MKLIERYIFRKAGWSTAIVLASLAGVVWIIQALRDVDIITSKGQTILAFLSLTLLAVPNLLLAIIPVALLLATIHTVNAMNANTELVVVSASGSSNWTIAKPLLALALIASLFAGLVGHFLSPLTLREFQERTRDIKADLVSVIIKEGEFNQIEKGLTFHIGSRGAGGILNNVFIADNRDPETSILYSAREGIIARNLIGSFLKLNDGEIQQTSRKDGSVTLIKYQSYLFDLSSFSAQTKNRSAKPKERPTWELLNPDENDHYYQHEPGRYRSQIHERFSEMLWPFAYVFVILAFCGQARSNRQSFATSMVTAGLCVVIMRGLGFSAITSLKGGDGSALMVYALPLVCMGFGAWFVFTNQPASLPKPIAEKLDAFHQANLDRFIALRDRYLQMRRRRAGAPAQPIEHQEAVL